MVIVINLGCFIETFWGGGFSENRYVKFRPLFSMCCMGLPDIHRFWSLAIFPKLSIDYIWTCTLTSVFNWTNYHTESYFLVMTHDGSIKLLVTYHLFQIQYRKGRNTHVSRVITFSVFLELLCKSTLTIDYKLNRFWPPRVEPICYSRTIIQLIQQVHIVI